MLTQLCVVGFGGSLGLLLLIGQDFFPTVAAGQFRLHVRAPVGTRPEETERIFTEVEAVICRTIPAAGERRTAMSVINKGNEALIVNPTSDLLDGTPVRAIAVQQK